MNRRTQLILGTLILIFGISLAGVSVSQILPDVSEIPAVSILDRFGITGGFEQELQPGECITVFDEKTGEVVDKTSRVVYIGDEIINEANIKYRVTRVRGDSAFARSSGVARDIVYKEEWDALPAGAGDIPVQANGGNTQVAIYHTHSGESYVPTDGTDNIPAKGGILKVGSTLASQLESKGIRVIDDKTPHEPHDANAYHRSRKTAVKLLQNRPVALLDVHRDGVPDPDFYNKKIQGQPITKIRLVVGRQNPKMATNLQFAKDLKAYYDKHKPGLIKGIFIGRGNYNQDLGPRALLLEVGTHTNTRSRAENGAALFADALPGILNIAQGGAGGAGIQGEQGSSWSTLGWIIGIVLVAGIAFLFISTGSVKGVRSKLGELRKTEFANFFGLKKLRARRKKDDD